MTMNPRPQGNTSVMLDEATSKRARAYAFRVGNNRAQITLDVGYGILLAAKEMGRMRRDTYDRMMANLERAEGAS